MSREVPALPPRSSHAKPGKTRPVVKILAVVFIVLLACGAATAGYLYWEFDNMLDETALPDSDDVTIPPQESPKKKAMTILLFGVDTRPQTGSANTDVIMAVTLNPERKAATMVSIPRDAKLQPEGYRVGKVNGFYAATRKKDNPEQEVKKIFGDYLGVPIDYIVVIDFKTFRDVVDNLGGIWVDVDKNMRYVDTADGTNINLDKGYQKLDGKQALDFVRYRKSNRKGGEPSSDFERNKRQQQVLSAIVGELKSFTAPVKIAGIFDAIGDNVKTDIPKKQVKQFITTYFGIDNESIEYIPLDGVWRSPYTYVDTEQFEQAKQRLQAQLN